MLAAITETFLAEEILFASDISTQLGHSGYAPPVMHTPDYTYLLKIVTLLAVSHCFYPVLPNFKNILGETRTVLVARSLLCHWSNNFLWPIVF